MSQLSTGKMMPEKMPKQPEKEKLPLEEEIAELSLAEAELIKGRKGKEQVQGKTEMELLQEQLREARAEVLETKLELVDFKKEKLEMEDFKKEVSKQLEFYNEMANKSRKMQNWTLPLHRMIVNFGQLGPNSML